MTSKSDNTKRGQRSDWADFVGWCEKYRRPAMPAASETIAYYLADRIGHAKVYRGSGIHQNVQKPERGLSQFGNPLQL